METREKLFSCLGEFCWYLAASNDMNFIKYYIKDYDKYADGWSAYGPTLFGNNGQNQVQKVIKLFKRKQSTR